MVKAKSGTSLERETRSRRNITLGEISHMHARLDGLPGNKPNQAIQHPDQPQYPSDGCVPPQRIPAQDQVQRERRAVDDGGEEDQRRGRHIVGQLEDDNLSDDFQRREVCSSPRRRSTAARGHELFGVWVGGWSRVRIGRNGG